MHKFNLANVDRSYMFRLLQNNHHQYVYNICKEEIISFYMYLQCTVVTFKLSIDQSRTVTVCFGNTTLITGFNI
jgi:hypothetical protein